MAPSVARRSRDREASGQRPALRPRADEIMAWPLPTTQTLWKCFKDNMIRGNVLRRDMMGRQYIIWAETGWGASVYYMG